MISTNSANAIDYFATIGRHHEGLTIQNTSSDPVLKSKTPKEIWEEAITEVIIVGQNEIINEEEWTRIGEPYGVNKLVLAFRTRKFSKSKHHIISIKFVSEFQQSLDDYQIINKSYTGQYKALLPQGFVAVRRSQGNVILESGPFLQNINYIKIPRSPGNLLTSLSSNTLSSSSTSSTTPHPFSTYLPPRYHLIPRVAYRNEKINPIENIYVAKYASSLSLSNLSFRASTIDRYPLEDYPDLPLPESPLPIFAFPRNLRLEISSKHEYPPSSFYSFVFSTLNKNEPLYAVCLKFYEVIDIKDLLPVVKEVYNEDSLQLDSNQTIFCPKVICLLSRYPLYKMMSKYLKQIYALSLSVNNCPLGHFITSVVGAVPIPLGGGRPFHIVLDAGLIPSNSRGMSPIEISKPPDYGFPWVDLDFSAPFRCLPVELVLTIFSILLQENRVLFLSCSNQMLTETMEVFRHLLFPLKWSCNFVSRLPQVLCDYLDAPGGFMMGLHLEPSELKNYFNNIPSVNLKDNSSDIKNTIQRYLANLHQDYPISPGTFVVDIVNSCILFKPDPEIVDGPLAFSTICPSKDGHKLVKLSLIQCRHLLDILPAGPRVRLHWTLEKICSLYNFNPQDQPLYDDNVFDYFSNFEEEDDETIQIINEDKYKNDHNYKGAEESNNFVPERKSDNDDDSISSSSSSSSNSSGSNSSDSSDSSDTDDTLSLSEDSSDISSENECENESPSKKNQSDDEGFGEHDERESFKSNKKEKKLNKLENVMYAKIKPNYYRKGLVHNLTPSNLFNFSFSSNGQRTVYNPIFNTSTVSTPNNITKTKGPQVNDSDNPLIKKFFDESSDNNLLNIYFPSLAIRDAFLSFMVDILGDFSKFCVLPHPTINPNQVSSNSSFGTPHKFHSASFDKINCNTKSTLLHEGYNVKYEYEYEGDDLAFTKDDFDKSGYIYSSDPSCRPLLTHLVETQMFSFLLQQRSEVMFQNHINSFRSSTSNSSTPLYDVNRNNNSYSSHLLFFEEAAALQRQLMLSALVPLVNNRLHVPELPLPLYQLVDANKKWGSIPQTVKHRILYCLSNGCFKLYFNSSEDKLNAQIAKAAVPFCPDRKVGGCVYRGRFQNEFNPVSSDSESDSDINHDIIGEKPTDLDEDNSVKSAFSNSLPSSYNYMDNLHAHHKLLIQANKKWKKENKKNVVKSHKHYSKSNINNNSNNILEPVIQEKPQRESRRKRLRRFLHLEHSRESFSNYYEKKRASIQLQRKKNENPKYFTILSSLTSISSTSNFSITTSNNNINTVANCSNIQNFFNINLNTDLPCFKLNMIQYEKKKFIFSSDIEDSFRFSHNQQYAPSLLLNQLLHFLNHLFGSHSESYKRQVNKKVKHQTDFIQSTIYKFIYGEQSGEISKEYDDHLFSAGKLFKGCQSECSDGFCCPCSYLHSVICKPCNYPSAATEASILTQLILPEKFYQDNKPHSVNKPISITNHQPFSPAPQSSSESIGPSSKNPMVYRSEYHTINGMKLNEYYVSKDVKSFQHSESNEIEELYFPEKVKSKDNQIKRPSNSNIKIPKKEPITPIVSTEKIEEVYTPKREIESDNESIDMNDLLLAEDEETKKIDEYYKNLHIQDEDLEFQDPIEIHIKYLLDSSKSDSKVLKKWKVARKEFSERLSLHLDHRECGPLILPGPTLPPTHRLSVGGGLIPNQHVQFYQYKDRWPELSETMVPGTEKFSVFWRLPLLQKVRELVLHARKTKSCYSVRTAFERNIHPLIHPFYPISPFKSDEISLKPYLTPHPPTTYLHITKQGTTISFQTDSNSNNLFNPHSSPYAQYSSYPIPASSIPPPNSLLSSSTINLTFPTQGYPQNTSSYPLIQPPLHPSYITPFSLLIDQVSISITLLCQRINKRLKPFHDLLQICGLISQLEQIGIASHLRESVWLSILVACGSYNDCVVLIKTDSEYEENFSVEGVSQENTSILEQYLDFNLEEFDIDYETLFGGYVEIISEEEWEFVKYLSSIIFHYILASGITPSSLTHAQYMDIINAKKKCINSSSFNKNQLSSLSFNDQDIKPTFLDMDAEDNDYLYQNEKKQDEETAKPSPLSEKELVKKLLQNRNSLIYIDTYHFLEELGAFWFIKKKEIVCREWANEYLNQNNGSILSGSTPTLGIASNSLQNSFIKQNSSSIKKSFYINLLSPISYTKELSDYYKIITPQKQSLSPFFLPRQMSAVSIPVPLSFQENKNNFIRQSSFCESTSAKNGKLNLTPEQRVIELYKQISKRKKIFLKHSSAISVDQMVFEIENEKSLFSNSLIPGSSILSTPLSRSIFSDTSKRMGDMSPMSFFNKFRKSNPSNPSLSSVSTATAETVTPNTITANPSTPLSLKAQQVLSTPSLENVGNTTPNSNAPILALNPIKTSSQKSFSTNLSGPNAKEFISSRYQEKEKDEMRELSSNLYELLLNYWSTANEDDLYDSKKCAIAIHSQSPCSCGFSFMEEEIFSLWSNANYSLPETLGSIDAGAPLDPLILSNGRRIPQFIRNPELGLFCTSCKSVISLQLKIKCYSLSYEKDETLVIKKSKNSRSYLKTQWEQVVPFLSPSALYMELERILPYFPLSGEHNSIYSLHPTLYWNIKYHLTRTCLPTGLGFDLKEPELNPSLEKQKQYEKNFSFNDPNYFLYFPVIIGYREEVVKIKVKRFLQGIPDNFFDVEDLNKIYSSEDVQILRDEVIPQLDGSASGLKQAIISISKCSSILDFKSTCLNSSPPSASSSSDASTASSSSTSSSSSSSSTSSTTSSVSLNNSSLPPKNPNIEESQMKYNLSRQLYITLLVLSTSLGHYNSYEIPKSRPSSQSLSSTSSSVSNASTPSISTISINNPTYNLFYHQYPHLLCNLLDTGTFQSTLEDCLENFFDDNELKNLNIEKDILLSLCKSTTINTFHAMFHTVT